MTGEPHIPTIDELIELPLPLDAQIAPDGEYVAYMVRTPDWKENAYIMQLWLVGTAGGSEPRQLTFAPQSSSSPRWSPDGKWLVFLSKRGDDKGTQIYRLSPFGGEAERLTELETDVQSIKWSPDGQSIAFTATPPENTADKKRVEQYGDFHVEDEDYQPASLWLLELESKKVRRLTAGDDLHITHFDWHPEGSQITLEAWPTPDMRDFALARLYCLDLATLRTTPVSPAGCYSPYWSPDGERIVFIRRGENPFYDNNEIWMMPVNGDDMHRVAAAFDESPWLLGWGEAGVYFGAGQRTQVHLFRLEPEQDTVRQITPDQTGWQSWSYTLTKDGTQAAGVVADAEHLGEVTVIDVQDGAVRCLTDFNSKVANWQLGNYEVIEWTSADGTTIEGVLTKPADFDPNKQYPLLVVIHGGPTATSFPTRLDFVERYYYPTQLWAAKGALILQPNYRGSGGYGRDFRALNVRNLGVGDYEDVISGVDALVAQGIVNPEQVGAMGWSQGGYISAFITTYSDRFKAVSVGAGISNWMTYYVNTDIHPFTREYLEATPWDDPDIYARTSPMTYIKNAKTPTLIQHGENDRRVPIPNAYELYQGLQDMGVETKLVVYKGMPHGITKPRLARQVMNENYTWFNRWIWGDEPEAPPAKACYLTTCVAEKREDKDDLPAIERYISSLIQDVYHWSRRDEADFRILSGEFGLLAADDPIPWYDHALKPEEVSELAAKVAEQLRAGGWKKLIFHTGPLDKDANLYFYLGCLQVAAGIAGNIRIEHQEISDSKA
ncbi:MAG: S9 family peptidase [Anaerolineaceae bacterium]|nr:S9 family peptidase [Anaerolineaceae bacterium]